MSSDNHRRLAERSSGRNPERNVTPQQNLVIIQRKSRKNVRLRTLLSGERGGVCEGGSKRSALPQKHKQLVSLLIVGQNRIPATDEETEHRLTQPCWPDGNWWSTYWTGLYCSRDGEQKRHGRSRQQLIQGRKTQGFYKFTTQNQAEV